MNKISIYLLTGVLSLLFASCVYDNYDEPESRLYGNVVYQGEPINVGFNQVTFELWEPGWQTDIPIDVIVAPDGSYSAVLFNSTYKLTIPPSQGPFRTINDTTTVNLNGDEELNIEVEPYYMINNTNITSSGNTVNATFGLEQIITGSDAKEVERVYLYVNKTQFVDIQSNMERNELAGADIDNMSNISLTVPVPDFVVDQNYLFARVGVKIQNVEDLLFSTVQKINL
jgi:hypothetical protein